jgi:hypothetical protein
MPAAAFGESEYLSDASGCRMLTSDGEHEHSSSPLWHAEVLRVKKPVGPLIPALGQRFQDDGKVPSAI